MPPYEIGFAFFTLPLMDDTSVIFALVYATLDCIGCPFIQSFYISFTCADHDSSLPACPGFGGINRSTSATGKLSLPIFGLASYKFRTSIWASDGTQERVTSLMQEADNWLRRIQVDHPDFRFFVSHFSTPWR